jgi:hypothetical protein
MHFVINYRTYFFKIWKRWTVTLKQILCNSSHFDTMTCSYTICGPPPSRLPTNLFFWGSGPWQFHLHHALFLQLYFLHYIWPFLFSCQDGEFLRPLESGFLFLTQNGSCVILSCFSSCSYEYSITPEGNSPGVTWDVLWHVTRVLYEMIFMRWF